MLPDTKFSAVSTRLLLLIIHRLVECCGLTPLGSRFICLCRPTIGLQEHLLAFGSRHIDTTSTVCQKHLPVKYPPT